MASVGSITPSAAFNNTPQPTSPDDQVSQTDDSNSRLARIEKQLKEIRQETEFTNLLIKAWLYTENPLLYYSVVKHYKNRHNGEFPERLKINPGDKNNKQNS